ncbi:DUF2292 domain-containing protein [Peribacillus frigoritolerans]|nr:DUF2292 domain-containing protein [Peribacillus frigoritolerans]
MEKITFLCHKTNLTYRNNHNKINDIILLIGHPKAHTLKRYGLCLIRRYKVVKDSKKEAVSKVLELLNTIKDGNLTVTFLNGEIIQLDSYEKFVLLDE